MTRGTAAERHAAFIRRDPGTGCWLWTGSDLNSEGYPRFTVAGRRVFVHRWSFEHFVRPLLPGEVVDHHCDTPLCSNPAHLKATVQRTNALRSKDGPTAVNARRTECVNGHRFTPDNTSWSMQNGHPRRRCKTCHRDREARRRARLV